MKTLKLGGAALHQTPLAWAANQANIIEAIQVAREKRVDILCLPELAITAYDCMDAFLSDALVEKAWVQLQALLPYTQDIAVAIGLPLMLSGRRYNAVAWVVNGQIEGFVCKTVLANSGVYYESRWFEAFPRNTTATLSRDGHDYPVGCRTFAYQEHRVGFEICEEAWISDRLGQDCLAAGADIILNPSASLFTFERLSLRRDLVHTLCEDHRLSYVFANQLGNSAGRVIYDGHVMVYQHNQMREGPYLSFDRVAVTTSDEAGIIPALSVYQKLTDAMSLALWDTLKKTKTNGFVVSLSGGVDSAAVAVAVRLMLEKAVCSLGMPAVQAELKRMPGVESATTINALMACVLTTVYQKTAQNSPETADLAAQLASTIGAKHVLWDVEPIFQAYQGLLGRALDWSADDIALQNLQARVRAPGAWLLANLNNALLLSTSNRSEVAVGYATMDGDTAGCFSPLAGLSKPFLQAWLHDLSQTHDWPVLLSILGLPPSAELRPLSAVQTDEADLMPYNVLNHIETYFRQHHVRDVPIVVNDLAQHFDYPTEQLTTWVERFFSLWGKSQWKRERYAPSFHFDQHSLCATTDCRMPIFSGD